MKLPDSISGRLSLTYIGLAVVPLLVVGIVLTRTAYITQRTQVLDLQQELAQRIGSEVEAYISNLETELRVTAQVTGLVERPQEEQKQILEQLRAEQKAFAELVLLNGDGMEIVHFSYKEIILERDFEDRSGEPEFLLFQKNPQARVYYGPVKNTNTGEPLMTIAIPLEDVNTGSLSAVLAANVHFRGIWDIIDNEVLDEGENIFIVDQQDRVVAHSNPSIVLRGDTYDAPDEKGSYTGLENIPVLIGIDHRIFAEQVFTVLAETPTSGVINLAFRSWVLILGLILLTIGVATALAIIAARYITRPVQALVTVANEIRVGNLSRRASTSGLLELDTLARTFNDMTAQLRQTLENLEQRVSDRTQALRTSAEVSRYLSTILDPEQLVKEVAELLQSSFHYSHVNIYLFDESGEELVLVAGTGEAGRNMLQAGHRVLKKKGVIGQAATKNIAVLASDVVKNQEWVHNPWLPETKAELVVPIARGAQVLGVFDIQHRIVDGLKQEDADLVQSIANQLAVALLNAQSFERLVAEKLAEAKQKEEAENRLEAYWRSPAGQAEIYAHELLQQPDHSLPTLHQLAQRAGQDPGAAALLSHLPKLLEESLSKNGGDNEPAVEIIAKLAEGYNYLSSSPNVPELLLPGLRTLTTQLELAISRGWQGSNEFLLVLQHCLDAIETSTIPQITQLEWKGLEEYTSFSNFPMASLVQTIIGFQSVSEPLIAYERVLTLQDKLAFLVTALERLRHIERLARSQLEGTDANIVLRIAENWRAIVTGALGELQTKAKISCHLLTRNTWQSDLISLTLSLQNNGRGTAVNLRIKLLPGPEYTVLDEIAELNQLPPGGEEQLILRIRPRLEDHVEQFRVRFVISYDDPSGLNLDEHFADAVQLIAMPSEFQYIPNPYVAGTPLEAGSALFFGREELLAAVQENLTSSHRNNLVLIGQRRMGKTSLLKNLSARLDSPFIPIYLDGQVIGLDPGMDNFFLNLATEISFSLEDRGIEIAQPMLEDFENSPAATFEHQFLPKVLSAVGGRQLIILFDEFEELERAVQRAQVDASIFGYLRHLMQHTPELSFIFCGTHRLEELTADYWNVLFNISLYQRVSYLPQQEAIRLITEPVQSFGMQYDDLALDKIWRVTAGHPYFLQLLCHSLVNTHNRTRRNYITIADVNAALEEILSVGEAHFIYLWMESTPEERMVLVTISRTTPLTGSTQAVQVVDYLAERGVQVERKAIREAMYRLCLREILKTEEVESGGESVFRWQLGLLGLWVEKYKSLRRVLDEVGE